MSVMTHPKVRAHHKASHSSVVTSVAFAPNGRVLASGSWDGSIKLWDIAGGELTLKRTYRGAWDEVEAIAFAPDGRTLAGLGTGFDDAPFGVVTLWNVDSSRGRTLIREPGKIDALAFAPDGATLATASGDRRSVTLWDVATGEELQTLPDHRGPIWSLAYSPDGTSLAVASGVVPAVAERMRGERIGELCLWDLSKRTPRVRRRLVGHEYGIISLAYSPDGAYLATGGFDRTAKLWGVEAGREWATLAGHKGWVAAVAFAPDGTMLATGSHDHTMKLWDVQTGRELATLEGHTGNIYSVDFSPDGSLLASGSLDGTVRLWNVEESLAWDGAA